MPLSSLPAQVSSAAYGISDPLGRVAWHTRRVTSRTRTVGVALALLAVLAACGNPARPPDLGDTPPPRLAPTFDLEAHRGGAALTSENTLEAFARALDIGVTTIELDAQVTRDGQVVIAHDVRVSSALCRDTAPASPADALYPYVGKRFRDLTLAQVRTVDCAVEPAEGFPDQRVATDGRVPLLREVVELLRDRHADSVGLNLEVKFQADAPEDTVPRADYVRAVWDVIESGGVAARTTIQSFDWASLVETRRIAPGARLSALVSGSRLEVGQAGASPWLAGIDIDDVDGDVIRAVQQLGGVGLVSPRDDLVSGDFVSRAHAAGLRVVPWTVDEPALMKHLIRLGVDGLITNRPDVLRTMLDDEGEALPLAHPAR